MKPNIIISNILFLVAVLFSSTAFSCEVSNLRTKDDVEQAQQCMIGLLETIDSLVKEVNEYNERVKATFEKLIAQEADCRKWEIYNEERNGEYNHLVKNCDDYYQARQEEYSYVMDQYNSLKEKFGGLESEREILALKIDTLKNAWDLIIKGNN